jgi:hypothetical protein
MNWEKGPVCGIDNCPSDLWRSAAGRTFCRYGHQRQDEYEYDNQDEGDLGGGRKVTIGSVSAMKDGEKEEQRWFGSRVYALRAQIFQEVLRFYTHWAMQKFDLDTDFEEVVKELWSVLIKYTDFGRSSYDLEGGVHSEPCDTGTSTPLLLSQKMAIEIMYLALVQVGYPISFIKILGWIMSGELPYDDVGARFTSKEARLHMSGSRSWCAWKKPPSSQSFGRGVLACAKALAREGVIISQPKIIPIMHTVEVLMLPLGIIDRTICLAKGCDIDEYCDMSTSGGFSSFMETASFVITAARIAYYKSWQSYDEDIKSPYWKLWSELAEIYFQDPLYTDEVDIPAWTDERYNEFLDIYHRSLMMNIEREPIPVQWKRVNDMFPLHTPSEEPLVTPTDLATILNEQVVPLPGPAPKEIESFKTTHFELFLQGPPLYMAVLESAAKAHNMSMRLVLKAVRETESMAWNNLRQKLNKKRRKERMATRLQECQKLENEKKSFT